MLFEEFAEQLTDLVRREVCCRMAEETAVIVQRVLKNNNTVRTALCILEPGSNISPNIYLEEYYEKWQAGQAMAQLAEEIVEEYRRSSGCRFLQVQQLAQWESMKAYAACKLIHADMNRELLADLPHRRFLDCALVYYLELSDPLMGAGTALIHTAQLERWQITEEELYRQAYENTKQKHGCRIRSLNQIMREIIRQQLSHPADPEPTDPDGEKEESETLALAAGRMEEELCCPGQDSVYVMTNREQYFGAVTLIYDEYLRGFADRFPGGFYVIPGCIHEVLLIPAAAGFAPEELQSLMQSIHEDLVREDPQCVLSDRIYYYDPGRAALILEDPGKGKSGQTNAAKAYYFTESPEFDG